MINKHEPQPIAWAVINGEFFRDALRLPPNVTIVDAFVSEAGLELLLSHPDFPLAFRSEAQDVTLLYMHKLDPSGHSYQPVFHGFQLAADGRIVAEPVVNA